MAFNLDPYVDTGALIPGADWWKTAGRK